MQFVYCQCTISVKVPCTDTKFILSHNMATVYVYLLCSRKNSMLFSIHLQAYGGSVSVFRNNSYALNICFVVTGW